jgi:thymidylate kinase
MEKLNWPAVAEENCQDTTKLALIQNLLEEFHKRKIVYCHWKSNEHLDASMRGDTDLDILFDVKHKEELKTLFEELQFKNFKPIPQKQYKDIEDFIGLDFLSGKIVHLHAHFKLTLGETYLKGFQLNYERKILQSRVFDNQYTIYRTHPALELVLLFFRESLKIRHRDKLRSYFNKKIRYNGSILKEFHWLRQECSDRELKTVLQELVHNYKPIFTLIKGDFNRKQLLKLSILLKKELTAQRLYSPWKALLLRWYRELSITTLKKLSKLLHRPVISQRINPRGGLIVAVIGADGSGKSTIVANLQKTFSKKLDVYRTYLGKGKADNFSWPRKLLVDLKKRFASTKNKEKISSTKINSPTTIKVQKASFYKCVEALIVSFEKYKKLKHISAAKRKGMLVLCDRFPQNQIAGYNDGPVLHHLSKANKAVFRAMSKMETRLYDWAERNPPDLVFKLIADAKIIQERKPSLESAEMLESKIEGIKKLQFAESCRVITIDATLPLNNILSTIKKEIWNILP